MEYQDLYDLETGRYIGQHQRGNRIPDGTYVHLVSIFTMNTKREILLTQRAENKSYPGQWETTAGAVSVGEDLVHAARRELVEETGIEAQIEELVYLGSIPAPNQKSFLHGFFLHRDVSVEQIRLQEGETMNAKWVPFSWSLTSDLSLAEPVRRRLTYFWMQLESFMDPFVSEDPRRLASSRLEPWMSWAKELQFYAQQGQAFANNAFDRERYDAISKIACEMLAHKNGIPIGRVLSLFAPVSEFYRTPNVEVRAAVIHDGKILLVKERKPDIDQRWSLPGGFCDPGLTIAENAEKEVFEESGFHVRPVRLIALEDRAHEDYRYILPMDIYKIYILCEWDGEETPFISNAETVERGFFAPDALPPLSLGRVTPRAIENCFKAWNDPHWQTNFD